MKHYLYMMLISIVLSKHHGMAHKIRKRQLFREQVLPHAGGKIPDSAFHTDRLALNRLQKDGIAVPDGILLEQRHHQVYPHPHRSARPTFLVAQTPDGRYTSPEGEFSHNSIATVDSTYVVPMPLEKHQGFLHQYPVHHPHPHQQTSSATIAAPVIKELRIPNHAVFNFDYSNLRSKLKPTLAVTHKHPVSLHQASSIVSSYGTPRHRLSPPQLQGGFKPSTLNVIPANFVSYHAALSNLLSYPVAAAYSNDWGNGWTPPSGAFPSGDEFSSNPLDSFEDFFGEPNGNHRYYRNVDQLTRLKSSSGITGRSSTKKQPSPSLLKSS
ncbi:uncharacterized protein LOC129755610 [Uranotaenia lowii]|uniref:uncharacterized protein LOC129755610 n=1 Tax=Uranotaenia lowii TaxID=190385 RepID=UPI00247AE6B3|nr:uncharacterized protein LOC129755610 [Uranotaenia lowii]